MSGAYVDSGSLVLQADSPVTITVGPCRIRFSQDDEVASSGIDFGVRVPFEVGANRVSTSNLMTESEAGKFQLLIAFTAAGTRGEFQAATYTLYQLS